jgi:hypothetical protein
MVTVPIRLIHPKKSVYNTSFSGNKIDIGQSAVIVYV